MNVAAASASAMLAAWGALHNGGSLIFYSGTQPATPETALSGNTALGTITFANPAFQTPTGPSGSLESELNAAFATGSFVPSSNGTAVFARALKSDGSTVLEDFTVGTASADIIVGNTAFQTGVTVTLSSLTLKMPAV